MNRRRCRLQELVADVMTKTVVDIFKSIQIEEQDGAFLIGKPGQVEGGAKQFLGRGTIRQPGQCITARL